MIYFDNAATTWPKPECVLEAMVRFMRECGANPGRSGHRLSIQAGRIVFEARERIARLFGMDNPLDVVFTRNATEALNLALFGLLSPGDHVITSTMEHNSVLRPLRFLETRGISVTRVFCSSDGTLDPGEVKRSIQKATRLVVLNHASNVSGTVSPIKEVGSLAREHDLLFCVDAAQTAGVFPINLGEMSIDLLAFTGHKALYGPQGTGGLCIGNRARKSLQPLLYGGTGSVSDSDVQPTFLPDRFESGTLNAVGLAGLAAGIAFIEERGLHAIRAHERLLTGRFIGKLTQIPGSRLLGISDPDRRAAVVSFTIEGVNCSDIAYDLDEKAEICCRAGLHCAPLAHKQLGTFPDGAVRVSFGVFNTIAEIDTAIEALQEIVQSKGGVA